MTRYAALMPRAMAGEFSAVWDVYTQRAYRQARSEKRLTPAWSHLPSILRRLTEDHLGVMKLELDDMTIEAHTRMVTVSNSPLLGNNLLRAGGQAR
jgi:hypothetical protein